MASEDEDDGDDFAGTSDGDKDFGSSTDDEMTTSQ